MRVVSAESETTRRCQMAAMKIILAHDTVTMADQEIEQIERLRRDSNGFSPATQFTAARVQHIVREEITHAAVLGRTAMVHMQP